jgi:hypothetical protein
VVREKKGRKKFFHPRFLFFFNLRGDPKEKEPRIILPEVGKEKIAKMLILPFNLMGGPDDNEEIFLRLPPLFGPGFRFIEQELVDLTQQNDSAPTGIFPGCRNPLLPLLGPSDKRKMNGFSKGKKAIKEAAISREDLHHSLLDLSSEDAGNVSPESNGELIVERILTGCYGKMRSFLHQTIEDVPEVLIIDLCFEICHPEEDHLCHMACRIPELHGRDGEEDEEFYRFESHLPLVRIFKNLGNLIPVVVKALFHKGLGLCHLPDAVEEMIEDS